jgi:integrase
MRPALRKAAIAKPFRPWHDLRHTALTHEAAAGNPAVYVQMKAGHAQGSVTERYVHAAQVRFPGAAEKGEARLFADVLGTNSGTN